MACGADGVRPFETNGNVKEGVSVTARHNPENDTKSISPELLGAFESVISSFSPPDVLALIGFLISRMQPDDTTDAVAIFDPNCVDKILGVYTPFKACRNSQSTHLQIDTANLPEFKAGDISELMDYARGLSKEANST